MEPNTMDCDTPTALRFLASSAKQAEAEWMRKAADEIERLVGLAAFASPDMVKWLTDQVLQRDNVIEAMKSAGMEQITKAFTENRWIPVEERLPPLLAEVLGWHPADRVRAWFRHSGQPKDAPYWELWSPQDRECDDCEVDAPTHWMPLPEPPEAK